MRRDPRPAIRHDRRQLPSRRFDERAALEEHEDEGGRRRRRGGEEEEEEEEEEAAFRLPGGCEVELLLVSTFRILPRPLHVVRDREKVVQGLPKFRSDRAVRRLDSPVRLHLAEICR